ncbi:mas-related G-protein coupled receptor member A6-like [Suncus etruscus]|uniref:mas-related G-protein coupled receptor member A6-like n=1 Tax=Suncus etruscus TaxID=109475 RepID=UPI00210F76DA|nr:mas-related G-protein coupled receptor member A6-like [Suncus etruscus]
MPTLKSNHSDPKEASETPGVPRATQAKTWSFYPAPHQPPASDLHARTPADRIPALRENVQVLPVTTGPSPGDLPRSPGLPGHAQPSTRAREKHPTAPHQPRKGLGRARNISGGFVSTDSTILSTGTEFTTLNGNYHTSFSRVDFEILIMNLLIIIISLAGMTGNVIVLWVLNFQIQKNAFSVYIINLAGANFLYLYFRFIYSLNWAIDISNSIDFYVPNIVYTMLTSAYVAGLSFLSAIVTERCFSVLYPKEYHCSQPNRISALLCALLWVMSLVLSTLNQNYCSGFHLCPQFGFVIATWLVLLFVLLSVSSLTLLVRLLCISKRMQLTRLYVSTGLTVLVFLLCGLPWGFYWFIFYLLENDPDTFTYELNRPAYILTCINSCASPIIYFFVGSFRQWKQHQKQNLKLILTKAFQDIAEVAGREVSIP